MFGATVWLVLAATLHVVVAEPPNCRAPGPEVPDITTRCNKTAACTDYCTRNQFSWDFLCCEDGGGWVAAHTLNPLAFYMFWQDPVWTMLVVLLWEIWETAALTFSGSFIFTSTASSDLETLAGGLIGDALIQGGTGIVIGALIAYVFHMPPLVPSLARTRAHAGARAWRAWRIVLWAVHTAFFSLLSWTSDDDTHRYGLWLNLALQVLFIAVLYPCLFYSGPKAAYLTPGLTWAGFAAWAAVVVAIGLSTAGWQYMANDWFQVWLTAAIIVTLLTAAALTVAARRRNGHRIGLWLALYALAVGLGLAIAGGATATLGLTIAAVVILLLGAIGCATNECCRGRAAPGPPASGGLRPQRE